jgi:hypothetical protein
MLCDQPDGHILSSQPGNLVQSLGTWLPQSRPFQLARWTSFLDPESNRLFIPSARPTTPPTFSVVHPLNRRMTHFISFDVINIPGPIQQVPELHLAVIPVVIIPQGPLVKIEKSGTPIAVPPEPATPSATSFTDNCSRLPVWEQQLILHVRTHESQVSLSDCLSENVPLCLCTDGGALKHIGSIGWVIVTDEEILWDCTGAAFGWQANYFRSEGLSHHSLFVFLQAFVYFYQPTVHQPSPEANTALPHRRPWIRAATDNEGLLECLAQALTRTEWPFPSDTLRAEYDVIAGLTTIIPSLTFDIHWEHVTGHQDDIFPKDQLTRMEQLNILADELATMGLDISTGERVCPFITPSMVELRVNQTTITSHYATHLHQSTGLEVFFKWYMDTFDWDTRIINSIDRDAHHAAIQKLTFAEKRFVTKFNFRWLPTGLRQSKVDPSQSTICPSYRTPNVMETETHLYQCRSRLPLVGAFFNKLQKFYEQEHTSPVLQDTLFTALQNEIFDRAPGFCNHHEDAAITRLRQEQTLIGWSQLFRGRFTTKWAEIQQSFLLTLVVDHRYFTWDLWLRKLISLLWKFNRSLWNARNLDRHGHTPLENQEIRRNRLQSSLHALYDSSPLMLAADRDIFHLSAESRLQDHHPAKISLWISRAKPIVAVSIQDATNTIKWTVQSIAGFFTRTHIHTLLKDSVNDSSLPTIQSDLPSPLSDPSLDDPPPD